MYGLLFSPCDGALFPCQIQGGNPDSGYTMIRFMIEYGGFFTSPVVLGSVALLLGILLASWALRSLIKSTQILAALPGDKYEGDGYGESLEIDREARGPRRGVGRRVGKIESDYNEGID